MKSKILTIIATVIFSSGAFAHGHEKHTSQKEELITGELIGMTCFIKHASKGPEHADCFKECAQKGLPIGILTKEDKIYQISGDGHADLKSENQKFLKYAGESVAAKGEIFTRGGMQMIVVKAIKKAQ